ncbi:pentapeptide repeat-containing protein [uncultured Dokdonia sp.]|uniref:pentapeptide repeat-containing protein n=1 Tax=uncultured Dokdonia sp. TaxID=575653 RepID=UPI0026152F04|nr:pentapeptide repeat-containing protein [uncultured Dokdonia sp.]
MSKLFLDQNYQGIDYTSQGFSIGEYDNCTFTNCLFPELHISNTTFLECTFIDCNFTNTKFGGTTLNDVFFKGCKMIGIDLSVCNDFMLSIKAEDSVLDLANCYQLNLSKTSFKECSLKEVDFTESNLSEVIFANCNLKDAIFDHTNLQKTDFKSALNYTIDLDQNTVKGAQFSKENIQGLLTKYGIKIS